MVRARFSALAVIAAVTVIGCGSARDVTLEAPETMVLESSAFDHEGTIPTRYTCDGEDISPALSWSGAPSGTVVRVLPQELIVTAFVSTPLI